MKAKIVGWLSVVAATAVLYLFAMPTYRQGEPSIAGRRAEDFTFEMNGHTTRLADLRGSLQGNDKLEELLLEAVGNTEKLEKLKAPWRPRYVCNSSKTKN